MVRPAPPHSPDPEAPRPGEDSLDPPLSRRPLSWQLQNLGSTERRCPLGPIIIHIASDTGNDCRDIFAKFIHSLQEGGKDALSKVGK